MDIPKWSYRHFRDNVYGRRRGARSLWRWLVERGWVRPVRRMCRKRVGDIFVVWGR
jgi:hypothetical protein